MDNGIKVASMIKIKRAYDQPSKTDGKRILVDRIWPRGIKKEEAKIDFWLKEIAPSRKLRKWFSHDPRKWEQFKERYLSELRLKNKELEKLKEIIKKNKVTTLVYGAKEKRFNQAIALKEHLENIL